MDMRYHPARVYVMHSRMTIMPHRGENYSPETSHKTGKACVLSVSFSCQAWAIEGRQNGYSEGRMLWRGTYMQSMMA